jgi:hypothetical protein
LLSIQQDVDFATRASEPEIHVALAERIGFSSQDPPQRFQIPKKNQILIFNDIQTSNQQMPIIIIDGHYRGNLCSLS